MSKKHTKPPKRDYQQIARGILDQIVPDAEERPKPPPKRKAAKKKATPKK